MRLDSQTGATSEAECKSGRFSVRSLLFLLLERKRRLYDGIEHKVGLSGCRVGNLAIFGPAVARLRENAHATAPRSAKTRKKR